MILPKLLWRPSPNVSARGAAVDLIVLHDCEGSYAGAMSWFANPASQVSAHFVLKEDGTEAAQMASLDQKAWHAKAFNSRSIGVEMGGVASRGFPDVEWDSAARVVAYLLHAFGLPCRWAQKGQGAGFTSHYDLGQAGGGHHDPTTDQTVWLGFVKRVETIFAAGGFPTGWARGEPKAGPVLQADIRDGFWLQASLNRLGADPRLDVDGQVGPYTKAALYAWQAKNNLVANGEMSPTTIQALEHALATLAA